MKKTFFLESIFITMVVLIIWLPKTSTAAPQINLSPSSLNFGTVVIGTAATATTLIQDNGADDLTVTSIAPCTGTSSAYTWSPSVVPFTVSAGTSTTLSVTFTPASAGDASPGCLNISSNDPANPVVALDVSATTASIVTPAAGPNGAISPSTAQTVVSNATASFTVTPNPGYQIALVTGCSGTLAGSTYTTGPITSNCTVTAAFSAVPQISLGSSSLSFGTVDIGTAATATTLIQNTGAADLVVTSIATCTGTSSAYTWSPSVVPFTVSAGTSTILSVTFTPTSAGAATGCLNISSNDPVTPVAVLNVSATAIFYTVTPVVAGTNLSSITVDPSGKYVYVANYTGNEISQYTIGPNGSLTAMSPATVATGTNPTAITIDPSGKYVYVANYTDNDVSQYTIGPNGGLTAMSPATVAAGTNPTSVTVDPSGKYVYVTNETDNDVSQYTIGTSGSLTSLSTPTEAAGTNPTSVTVDPSDKYVYVTNETDNDVSQYTIGSDGSLTSLPTPTEAAGTNPTSVAIASSLSVTYAYVANYDSNDISQYTIGSDGSLTSLPTATVSAASGAISPSTDQSVISNATASFTVTPNPGYQIASVTGCSGTLAGSTYTTSPITSNCTVTASFSAVPQINLSPSSLNFGVVPVGTAAAATTLIQNTGPADLVVTSIATCTGTSSAYTWTPSVVPFTVSAGTSTTLSVAFTPAAVGPATGCLNISSNDPVTPVAVLNVSATAVVYTVTPSAGPNGAISPSTAQTVISNATASFTVTPNPGYQIALVTGCSGTLAGSTYTTGPITSNCTVTATFSAVPQISLSPSSLNFGTIAVGTFATATTLIQNNGAAGLVVSAIGLCSGTSSAYTWSPSVVPFTVSAGTSTILSVTFTPTSAGAATGCLNISSNDPVTPVAVLNVSATAVVYTVTPVAGPNGVISPSTPQTVGANATVIFTVTPNSGYQIISVTGCGGTLAGGTYTTGPIKSNCMVNATFSTVTPLTYQTYTDSHYGTGQTFYGSGALASGGSYTLPQANPNGTTCLSCHQAAGTASDKTLFLETGHKNILKKADSSAWTAPPDLVSVGFTSPYVFDARGGDEQSLWMSSGTNGDLFQWFTPSASDSSVLSTLLLSDGSGVRDLYYIWGGNLPVYEGRPLALYDASQSGTYQEYSCSRCHTTGWSADTAFNPAKKPLLDYPNFKGDVAPRLLAHTGYGAGTMWTSGSFSIGAQHNYPVLFADLNDRYANWVEEGISCERCHDATSHVQAPAVANASIQTGAADTDLCLECHRQEEAWQDPINTSAIPYGSAIRMGTHDYPLKDENGYIPGQEFLNSPHARFAGNMSTISTPTNYQSQFTDADGSQGNCSTCHDVHVPLGMAGAIRKECADCHVSVDTHNMSAPTVSLSLINHPTGPGTPMAVTDPSDACVTCHMPSAAAGQGSVQHFMRINTNPTYSTWPTYAAWTSGECSTPNVTENFNGNYGVRRIHRAKTCISATSGTAPNISYAAQQNNYIEAASRNLNTAPESYGTGSTYANAIWTDVNDACGQCHGGGTAYSETTGTVVAGTAMVTVASTTGFAADQKIIVSGAGYATCQHLAIPDLPFNEATNPDDGTLRNIVTQTACGAAGGTWAANDLVTHIATVGQCYTGPSSTVNDSRFITQSECETTACDTTLTCNGTGVCSDGESANQASCVSGGGTWTLLAPAQGGNYGAGAWHPNELLLVEAALNSVSGTNVVQNFTTNEAVYIDTSTLALVANNMHLTLPTASFIWSNDTITSYLVNFDASGSTCPTGATCSYLWQFGDGSPAGSGQTTSHQYASSSPVTVTLTVSASPYGTTSVPVTQTVTPKSVNVGPSISYSPVTVTVYTVSFTDESTDKFSFPSDAVTVNWDDGSVSTNNAGSSFSHTYELASTYRIRYSVTDILGLTSMSILTVAVPQRFMISGTVTASDGVTPLSGVTMALKLDGHTRQVTRSAADGSYSFSNVLSGSTYTIQLYESGYTFNTQTLNNLTTSQTLNISAN